MRTAACPKSASSSRRFAIRTSARPLGCKNRIFLGVPYPEFGMRPLWIPFRMSIPRGFLHFCHFSMPFLRTLGFPNRPLKRGRFFTAIWARNCSRVFFCSAFSLGCAMRAGFSFFSACGFFGICSCLGLCEMAGACFTACSFLFAFCFFSICGILFPFQLFVLQSNDKNPVLVYTLFFFAHKIVDFHPFAFGCNRHGKMAVHHGKLIHKRLLEALYQVFNMAL